MCPAYIHLEGTLRVYLLMHYPIGPTEFGRQGFAFEVPGEGTRWLLSRRTAAKSLCIMYIL